MTSKKKMPSSHRAVRIGYANAEMALDQMMLKPEGERQAVLVSYEANAVDSAVEEGVDPVAARQGFRERVINEGHGSLLVPFETKLKEGHPSTKLVTLAFLGDINVEQLAIVADLLHSNHEASKQIAGLVIRIEEGKLEVRTVWADDTHSVDAL